MTGRTEQEQIEDIKQWWEKHGKTIIIGVIFLISGVIGGQVWMDYQESTKARVSYEYDSMLNEMRDGNIDSAMQHGSMLIEKNAESAYAPLAALALAKMDVEKGDLAAAATHLRWVVDHATLDEVKAIARVRLAKVLLAQDNADEALSLVTGNVPSNFIAAFANVRGDIFVKKGDVASAKTAYQSVLDDQEATPQVRQQVQLKLDALGA